MYGANITHRSKSYIRTAFDNRTAAAKEIDDDMLTFMQPKLTTSNDDGTVFDTCDVCRPVDGSAEDERSMNIFQCEARVWLVIGGRRRSRFEHVNYTPTKIGQ